MEEEKLVNPKEDKGDLIISVENGTSTLVCRIPESDQPTEKLLDSTLISNLLANYPYISPSVNRIPIMGIDLVNQDFNNNDSKKECIVKQFKEGGFDCIIQYTDNGKISDKNEGIRSFKNLNYWFKVLCKYQVKAIVSNVYLLDDKNSANRDVFFKEMEPTFIDHNMLGAWHRDEPTVMDCCRIVPGYELMLEQYPSIMFMLNLAGPNNKTYDAGLAYPDYLQVIQDAFHPGVWSFDYYPILSKEEFPSIAIANAGGVCKLIDSNKANKFDDRKVVFYKALESMLEISKKTLRPFWSVVLSQSHYSTGVSEEGKTYYNCYPPATLGHLRFGVFSALAYGAQGISYYRYNVNKSSSTACSALTDGEGNLFDAWYNARQVNSEIRAYEHIFLGANVLYTRHLGDKIEGTTPIKFPFGPLVNMTCSDRKGGLMASILNKGGRKYLVVVSRNPFESQTVKLYFEDISRVQEITPTPLDFYGVPDTSLDGNLINRTLQPGACLIYEF